MSRLLRGGLAAITAILLVSVIVSGCSSDGEPDVSAPATTSTLVPSSSGDRCDDPIGDLDVPVGTDPTLASLTGVDIVSGVAEVNGDNLDVVLTTAGPVADVVDPTFVVAQGDPLEPLSFELRITRADDGRWESTLITWPSGRELRRPVTFPVVAEGTTVSTQVPLSSLPPIALALQFGSASTLSSTAIVIDDCSSLTPS